MHSRDLKPLRAEVDARHRRGRRRDGDGRRESRDEDGEEDSPTAGLRHGVWLVGYWLPLSAMAMACGRGSEIWSVGCSRSALRTRGRGAEGGENDLEDGEEVQRACSCYISDSEIFLFICPSFIAIRDFGYGPSRIGAN
jgi:hypothetical protein